MEPREIEQYRERLLALRRDLSGGVAQLKEEGLALGTDGTQDSADDASNSHSRQLLLGLSERDRDVLRQVDEALDRIDDGSFGECGECGDPIGTARLDILPYVGLCVECKANQERQSR